MVRVSSLIIAIASVYLAVTAMGSDPQYFSLESHLLDQLFFYGEIILTLYLLYRCKDITKQEFWIPLVIIAQGALMLWVELSGTLPKVEHAFYIDNFSIIMALIIGIIGTLITVYAVSYMKEYHHHHSEIKDRQRSFFFIFFLFLSGMFGVVFCNNLIWLFLFWEITTLSSFQLIGYSKTPEATRNAFRALGLNSLGGLAFVGAIVYLVKFCPSPTIELSTLISMGPAVMLLPAILLCFAGLTKSAQMPFSSWLLGAMVAPTPVSALLHSSTMVKAGVFIIVKLGAVLAGTMAGQLLAGVGGVTFLMTSILAVTQSNAKRVLAYSTIANLGLIVMCAGVGTSQAIWAAILLIIFHAVSKALLFLSVGTFEHKSGSRDIEDMDGLIVSRSSLGLVMLIGILGMFLAPFGMLISKWACLQALVDASPWLAILLAYGSGPTLFFWAKWMGKIISVPVSPKKISGKIAGDEWLALWALAIGTIAVCGLFPVMGTAMIEPYIQGAFGEAIILNQGNSIIMLFMLGIIIILPIMFLIVPKSSKLSQTYLAGANVGGSANFTNSLGIATPVVLHNYYLSGFFKEKTVTNLSIISTILIITAMFLAVKA